MHPVRIVLERREVRAVIGRPPIEVRMGLQGPPGPPGPAGAGLYHLHEQTIPATEWVINHNFGRYPNVSVLSPAGEEVLAEVVHHSPNQVRVRFGAPRMGYAVCV